MLGHERWRFFNQHFHTSPIEIERSVGYEDISISTSSSWNFCWYFFVCICSDAIWLFEDFFYFALHGNSPALGLRRNSTSLVVSLSFLSWKKWIIPVFSVVIKNELHTYQDLELWSNPIRVGTERLQHSHGLLLKVQRVSIIYKSMVPSLLHREHQHSAAVEEMVTTDDSFVDSDLSDDVEFLELRFTTLALRVATATEPTIYCRAFCFNKVQRGIHSVQMIVISRIRVEIVLLANTIHTMTNM